MHIESQPSRGAIVVADDDEGERYLLERALEDAGIQRPVVFVESGERLIEFLLTLERSEQPLRRAQFDV